MNEPVLTPEERHQRDAAWVSGVLTRAQGERFYGEITLLIDHGTITRIRQTATLKYPEGMAPPKR